MSKPNRPKPEQTAANLHVQMLEASPILPNGRPYGVAEFGGDVDENDDCRRVATKLNNLAGGIRWKQTLEIGTGGGRWTRWLHPRTEHLMTVDASPKARQHVEALHLIPPPVCFVSKSGSLPTGRGSPLHKAFDLAFTYDTFVHLDRPTISTYIQSIAHALTTGGWFACHYGTQHNKRPDQPTATPQYWTYVEPYWLNTQAAHSQLEVIDNWTVSRGFGSAVTIFRKRG